MDQKNISENMSNEDIEELIFFIRNRKVILDSEIAKLYRVETKVLLQSVKRNQQRFPTDFMFQLTFSEVKALKDKLSDGGWGGRRTKPFVFTEQGVVMLSSVLRSERAISVNIMIMRAFVQIRKVADNYKELSEKLKILEKKYDHNFKVVFDALRGLMALPHSQLAKKPIGFNRDKD